MYYLFTAIPLTHFLHKEAERAKMASDSLQVRDDNHAPLPASVLNPSPDQAKNDALASELLLLKDRGTRVVNQATSQNPLHVAHLGRLPTSSASRRSWLTTRSCRTEFHAAQEAKLIELL